MKQVLGLYCFEIKSCNSNAVRIKQRQIGKDNSRERAHANGTNDKADRFAGHLLTLVVDFDHHCGIAVDHPLIASARFKISSLYSPAESVRTLAKPCLQLTIQRAVYPQLFQLPSQPCHNPHQLQLLQPPRV